MFDWIRRIPHPSYGNYGGAYNKCDKKKCPVPVDWMDQAYRIHDKDLKKARKEEYKVMKKIKCMTADFNLGIRLREGDPKKLKYKTEWFRETYLKRAMGVFKV